MYSHSAMNLYVLTVALLFLLTSSVLVNEYIDGLYISKHCHKDLGSCRRSGRFSCNRWYVGPSLDIIVLIVCAQNRT